MDEKEEKIQAEILENNYKDKQEVVDEKTEISNNDENIGNNKSAVAVLEKEKTVEKENTEKQTESNKKDTPNVEKKYNQYQLNNKKSKKSKKGVAIIIIVVIVLLILGLVSTGFALLNANKNTILNGISIRNTLVEGLTEKEAIALLNEKIEQEKQREIILKVAGEMYSITPEQINAEYNIEDAVNKAYQIGRNGNIFQNNFEIIQTLLKEKNLDVDVTFDENLLNSFLQEINAKLPDSMADNTYSIEEDKLIITKGTAGIVVDFEDAKQQIIENIKQGKNEEIELKVEYKECPEIDIDKIYSEVKTEPQNASYKTNPFEVIPHKNGIDFDLEEARELLKEEKDEYSIKLIITEPEILTNEIGEEAFPDLLSSFSTKYDETNVPRSKNLKIAMSKLDGVVVMPGEVFSYNKTLGKRTVEEGYEYANGFSGGKVVPMLAGGICQISSTLYDAVLYANLNIVERHNHMFQAGYVEPGKDATVVYGSLDFKFENTRKYPIMIKTKTGGGLAEIKIFGIKEEVEYEVEIVTTVLDYTSYKVVYQDDTSLAPGQERVSQYGLKGCNSITHRIIKLNGQEVKKEVLSKDSYSPLNKIVRRGVTVTQKPVETTPTTPETPSTTETPTTSETPTEPTTPSEPTTPTTPTESTTPTVPETPSQDT